MSTTINGVRINPNEIKGSGSGTISGGNSFQPDASAQLIVDIALDQAATLLAPTNGTNGRKQECRFKADGTNRVVTLGTGFVIPSSSSMPSPFTVFANTMTVILLDYRASDSKWIILSYVPGC